MKRINNLFFNFSIIVGGLCFFASNNAFSGDGDGIVEAEKVTGGKSITEMAAMAVVAMAPIVGNTNTRVTIEMTDANGNVVEITIDPETNAGTF